MQIVLQDRVTLAGPVTVFTPPVDVSGFSLLTGTRIVHAIGGTAPVFNISLETSDDLETWSDVATVFPTATAVGVDRVSCAAESAEYGRYVRAKMVVGGAAKPVVTFSLYLNVFVNE